MAIDISRLNVLLVDDNSYMRALLKQILSAFGVRSIVECSDGSDAIRMMKDLPIDIVIADWMMEPVDGLDMTRLLRTAKDSPNPLVPIILLTGHTERHRVEEARDSGVTEFLSKPVSAKSVYDRIQQIVEKPRGFVRAERFSGPDRRRRDGDDLPADTEDRRKDKVVDVDSESEE